jgi:hypothetical protein
MTSAKRHLPRGSLAKALPPPPRPLLLLAPSIGRRQGKQRPSLPPTNRFHSQHVARMRQAVHDAGELNARVARRPRWRQRASAVHGAQYHHLSPSMANAFPFPHHAYGDTGITRSATPHGPRARHRWAKTGIFDQPALVSVPQRAGGPAQLACRLAPARCWSTLARRSGVEQPSQACLDAAEPVGCPHFPIHRVLPSLQHKRNGVSRDVHAP